MKRTLVSVLFYLKVKSESEVNQRAIYMRVTVEGQRAEISISSKINPRDWNQKTSCSNRRNIKAVQLNEYIDLCRLKIFEAHKELLMEGELVSAESIKLVYLGKDENSKIQ